MSRYGGGRRPGRAGAWICILSLIYLTGAGAAQTRIEAPGNRYTPAQDVELGRQAAAEVEKEMPLLRDSDVNSYIQALGRRLVEAVPAEFRHPEFRYSFSVINARDINAFALPGGPMYLNRGMIEAAGSEAEIAGVMAHELSHVALRHGTAQATRGERLQIGAIAGAILGSILGGGLGELVAQGSQFGLGAVFLRFSRDFEKQADLLGAQMMARAGYDPGSMARMFQTIENAAGSGGPQWLSSHPNPGNRSAYIKEEASRLTVTGGTPDGAAFNRVRSRLQSMPRAPSTDEIMRGSARREGGGRPDAAPPSGRVPAPSAGHRTYRGGVFQVTLPDNWHEEGDADSVRFTPPGASGQVDDRAVYTHGMEFGRVRGRAGELRDASEEFLEALSVSNPELRRRGGWTRQSVAGRPALAIALENVSEAGGRIEEVWLQTTLLGNGDLFYSIAVAPRREMGTYRPVFTRVLRSLRIRD